MRAGYWVQVGRGASRLLNALLGGEGDTTFSAASWDDHLRGRRLGALRVRLIDAMWGEGHCLRAWEWHAAHGLFVWDDAG